MVRPSVNMVRIPKRIAPVVEGVLNTGRPAVLDNVDLTSRNMYRKLEKQGLIDVKINVVVSRRPLVTKPKKRNGYKKSVWLALAFSYSIICYDYILAWVFLFRGT